MKLEAAFLPVATAITDDSGKFIFQNVSPGIYRISAVHDGFVRGEYSRRGHARPGTPVFIAAGQNIKDLVIGLTPTGVISGRTYTPEGNPVAYATVQVLKHLYIDGRRMLTVWKQSRTNELGNYRFDALHPGQYFVSAIPPERGAGPGQPSTAVRLENGETYLPIYFPETLEPEAAAPIDLLPGVDYTGVSLRLTQQKGLHVRGHLIGAFGSTVMAAVFRRETRTAIAGSTAPRAIHLGQEGVFGLEDMVPGFHDLVVTEGDGPTRRFARTTLAVDRDIDDLRLVLQPAFELKGMVTLDGANSTGENAWASNSVRLELVHEPFIAQVAPPGVNIRPDGSFIFRGTIPGEYRIRVATTFQSYVSEARLGSADLLTAASHVDETVTDILRVRLNPNVGALDAAVFDEQNASAPTVQVVLVPDYPKRVRLDLYQSRMTDEQGHVHFDDVEPGIYKAFAWESLESGSWRDADFIRRYEDLGTSVRIGERSKETVNINVIRTRR